MRFALLVAFLAAVAVAVWPTTSTTRPSGGIAFASYVKVADPVMGPLMDGRSGTILLWRNGRVTTLLSPDQWESFDSPIWSADGATISAGRTVACWTCSPPEEVHVRPDGTELGTFSSLGRTWPAPSPVSPDGRWVAYAAGPELRVAPRSGGKGVLVARCPELCGDPAWRPASRR